MPWLVDHTASSSSSPSERQCDRTSFALYRAVRDALPVWLLEDMRTMEVFSWEDGRPRAFTPSEALMYALVHDHQDYARHLLGRFSLIALGARGRSFCRCKHADGAPHLRAAVRYNRVSILGMIVDALKDFPTLNARQDYLESRGGCAHSTDAGKTAVEVACTLARPECLMLLLEHGARPGSALDILLQQLQLEAFNMAEQRGILRCMHSLLLFLPKTPALLFLRDEPQRWQSLLGEDVFRCLSGIAPPTLLLQVLRTLARDVPGQLAALPDFLQPHSWL
ncbi:ankyrin repeat domain-containing protein 9-like [Genypterus blacodes]|uniref:ankyrin repeat domain-containing protein 9-like n=1 Tax=Genypterus blacodes TaxID=154954 RepID=UPI003F769AA3